ncbi:hypothetical protein OHAE_1989 [Ochrobactrum soli]|uniref:Uncharacterized protein n=1 Tax=Ochrobactrum soli TaxID=2448455 RepID=A0A2P9HPY6_9HYPH|nr:hypothetical protein OHAE_1989 [[Ochrobactrum] soli]
MAPFCFPVWLKAAPDFARFDFKVFVAETTRFHPFIKV